MTLHAMDVLDRTGHLTVNWNPDDEAEVRAARATFTEMVGKGYSAFEVGENGKGRGERLRTFDPNVEEMILVPPVVGG